MARSRNIKPGFFTNEDLVELDFATRLLFAGLWTVADKEGRLQDRPKKIKIDVFPADNLDIDTMLQALHNGKFIVRYEVDGSKYIQISNWSKHQNPHHTEKASEIPGIDGALTVKPPLETRESPKQDGGNLADSLLLIPDSLIPDSKKKTERTTRGSRLSSHFEPDFDFAKQEGIQSPSDEFEKFKDYWFAQPGSKGVKLDWQATWRNWCRNAKPNARAGPAETTYQRSMRERVDQMIGRNKPSPVIDVDTAFLEIENVPSNTVG